MRSMMSARKATYELDAGPDAPSNTPLEEARIPDQPADGPELVDQPLINSRSRRRLLIRLSAVGLSATGIGSGKMAPPRQEPPPSQPSEGTFDAADQGNNIGRLLAAGRSLLLPAGVTVLTDQWILQTGQEFAPAENSTIAGSGPSSVLRLRRVAHPSFAGLSIRNSGVTFRDMTLEIDVNGGSWCAGVALSGEASNLRFERVVFRGVGDRGGAYGVTCLFHNFSQVHFEECHFENLDFGFVKAMHDPSVQRDITAQNCTAFSCTEVFEFNSPGIFDGYFRAGGRTVSGITTGTAYLRPGMRISSPALPIGTYIISIDSSANITVSNAALKSGSRRVSVGEIRGVVVRGLRVRGLSQWALGLANTHDFDVEVYGEDCDLDLVHIEDHSSNGRARVGGRRCNLKTGQVGSALADNAAVLVIAGSHDIRIEMNDFDLTQNEGGMPNGVCVQKGIAGTTNTSDACTNIVIGGRLRAGPGCVPVVAQEVEVRLDDLVIAAPGGLFPQADVKLLSGTRTGNLRRVAI